MLKTVLFVLACACASKPESLTVQANSSSSGKYHRFKAFGNFGKKIVASVSHTKCEKKKYKRCVQSRT